MKQRLWPYGLFAACGVALALGVTLQTGPKHQDGQAWESFKPDEVKGVAYQSSKMQVHLLPLSMSYGWLEFAERGQSPQTFLVGSKAKSLWFNLSPLWASKVLGEASRLNLSEFELDKEDKAFQIELISGQKRELRIGGRGFQSSDYFVLDLQKQIVWLWDRQTLDLIEHAPAQLALTQAEFLSPGSLNKIVLMVEGRSRTLLRVAKEWQEDGKAIFAEEPLLKWLEKASKAPVSGFRSMATANGELLFSLTLEGDNAFQLRFFRDAQTKDFWISLGDDKPVILLDQKAFSALHDEFLAGKFLIKI